MLLIPLTQSTFGFPNTDSKTRSQSKGRRRRRRRKFFIPPHSLIFQVTACSMNRILSRLQVSHYVAQFVIRGARRGCFCEYFISSATPCLSPLVSGQVPTQWVSYLMKWGSRESLPKSKTSVKPQCFRHSVLKRLSLSPYPHSCASPVSLLQHLTISLHSLWQQWAGLWGGCSPEKPHREI